MNNLTKYIAVSCAAILVSLFMSEAKAATVSDETSDNTAASGVITNGVIDLDVPNYLVRYLYRDPDVDEVKLDHWYDGWGLMLYWNPDMLWPTSSYTGYGRINDALGHRIPVSIKGLGMAVSKDFTKSSAVRAGINYSQVSTREMSQLKRLNVSLDYVWNLSNTYYGYDLHRANEWLLTMGAKAGMVSGHDIFGAAQMGLQYRKNIANNMSFFIEPQFAIFSDDYDRSSTFHDVDLGLNALVGLYFRLTKPQLQVLEENGSLLANSFFQAYSGFARNDATSHTYDGLKPMGRRHINFGFGGGVWFNPSIAARLGYFENVGGIGLTATDHPNGKLRYQTLRGGRAELIVSPLSVFGTTPYIGRIGWEISGGIEAGQIRKHGQLYNNRGTDNTFTAPFVGITLGSQLKYFLSDHYALFLEGRLSNPSFKADAEPGITGAGAGERLNEAMFSTAAGLEYYVSSFARYRRWAHGDTHQARSIDRLLMFNRLFLEGAIGGGHPVHWGEAFRNALAPQAALALGINFNDYHGARLRGSLIGQRNYSYLNEYKWHSKVGVDYMLNLTNLWWGTDVTGTRWSDIYLFAGPTLQVHPRHLDDPEVFFKSMGVGGEFGAQFTRRILPGLDIFVEPRYEVNQKSSNRWDLMAGFKLHQWQERNEQYVDSLKQHANTWFLEVAPGIGSQLTASREGIKDAFKRPDFSGKIGVGYRFNPYSSVRVTSALWLYDGPKAVPAIFNRIGNKLFDTNNKASWKGKSYGRADAEVAVDYMANITNLWYGVNPYRRFNVRAFAGPTFSPMNFLSSDSKSHKLGVGFEAGLQGTYSVADNIDILLEPRAETFFNDKSRRERGDLYAGVIFYNQRGLLPRKGYNPTDIDDHKTWFMELAGGLSFAPTGRRGGSVLSHIDPVGHVGVGMHVNNYSSVRGRGSLTYVRNYTHTAEKRHYIPEVSLDYMHNISNQIMGVNPYRRFDLNLFAGPVAYIAGLRTLDLDFDWGFNAGAQLAWHINNCWDLFGEPRIVFCDDNATRYEVLGGLAYRFNRNALKKANLNVTDKLFTQFLMGGQIFSVDAVDDFKKNARWLDYDYRLGYHLNGLVGVQAGIFADRARVASRKAIEEFGVRGEVALSMLNLVNPSYNVYENRWNWTASAGVDVSRLRGARHHRSWGGTAATQLQYRVLDNAWALFELRARTVNHDGLSIPVTAQIGMQYDFKSAKHELSETSDYYVMGGLGLFDAKGGAYELGFGYDASPVHGVRVMGAAGVVNVPGAGKWLSIEPDYVLNVTNMMFGHDDDTRHLDFSVLAGLSYTMRGAGAALRNHNLSQLFHVQSQMGVNFGAQLSYNLNKSLAIYTEPRFTLLGSKSDMIPTKSDCLNLFTTLGVKYYLAK